MGPNERVKGNNFQENKKRLACQITNKKIVLVSKKGLGLTLPRVCLHGVQGVTQLTKRKGKVSVQTREDPKTLEATWRVLEVLRQTLMALKKLSLIQKDSKKESFKTMAHIHINYSLRKVWPILVRAQTHRRMAGEGEKGKGLDNGTCSGNLLACEAVGGA
jgi:hypothetical protein